MGGEESRAVTTLLPAAAAAALLSEPHHHQTLSVFDLLSSFLFSAETEMGVLDHFSGLFDFPSRRSKYKKNQLETVEIKVKMDCEGCERRVEKAVKGMEGVSQVDIDPKKHKLTVIGYVDPKKVLRRVKRRTGKRAEFWPYIHFDEVAHPYAPGTYDKKAPSGYVRNVQENTYASQLARGSSREERYTGTFSDENPNACSVM